MYELKTKITEQTVEDIIAHIENPELKQFCKKIAVLFEEVSKSKAVIWSDGTVGYGTQTVKYANGNTLDWFRLGFAIRKNYLSLYFPLYLLDNEDVNLLYSKLGKHTRGKGCINIKDFNNIDFDILKEVTFLHFNT